MFKKISLTFLFIAILMSFSALEAQVRITDLKGDVKIRKGMEETWRPAELGKLLDEIDTILTGNDNSSAKIVLVDGANFELGSNSYLDIIDLRKISENEMMLFLMSQKVKNIEPRNQKTPLRVGNVSVVHGESKSNSGQQTEQNINFDWYKKETNGARALYANEMYTNAVIKLNKIKVKYAGIENCAEINYYLGQSFEALNQNGQAIDAYEIAINTIMELKLNDTESQQNLNGSKLALKRLKK